MIPIPTDIKVNDFFNNPNTFHITNENLNFPFQCYFVGGRLDNIKEALLPSLKKELGLNLVFGGHKDPTKKSFPIMPLTTKIVFHFKDMSSHPIREWAKKEADDLGVPFIEITQKIKASMETIQKHYASFWEISKRFKMLREVLSPEDVKQEEEFFVLTIENFIKQIIEKEDWIEIETSCLKHPYALVPVNVNNENPIAFYRKSIRENINLSLAQMEKLKIIDNPSSDENLPKRVEEWYEQGVILLSDHMLHVIQGKSPKYTKEQNLETKRLWLMDMITDANLSKEWTKNFNKIDSAFKMVFGCSIPSTLKGDVKEMLEMKYQDEYQKVLDKKVIQNEPVALPVIEEHILQEHILQEQVSLETLPQSILDPEPIPQKEETVMKQTDIKTETKFFKTAGINGMKFQMTAGATLLIENIQINELDLKECSQVIIKNVNGNQIGEMKLTF